MRRLAAVVALKAVAVLILFALPASAHSSLVTSSPSPGQTVGGELELIDMIFDAGVEDVVASVEAPDGAFLDVDVERPAENWIRIALETPASDGQYIVRYEFVSADGDPVESAYAFSYDEAAPEAIPHSQTTAVLVSSDGDRSPSLATLVSIGLAIGVLLLATLLLIRLRELRAARAVVDGGP